MKAIGLYAGEIYFPYVDKELDDAIYNFQKLNDLKVDGLIASGGETEYTNNKLGAKSPQQKCPNCGGWHGGVYGDLCPSCTIKQ